MPRRVTCMQGHPYTPENTMTNGEGFRTCRHCTNNRQVRRRMRRELEVMSVVDINRQMELCVLKLGEIQRWLKKNVTVWST